MYLCRHRSEKNPYLYFEGEWDSVLYTREPDGVFVRIHIYHMFHLFCGNDIKVQVYEHYYEAKVRNVGMW